MGDAIWIWVLAIGPFLVAVTVVRGWATGLWKESMLVTLASVGITALVVGWVFLVLSLFAE